MSPSLNRCLEKWPPVHSGPSKALPWLIMTLPLTDSNSASCFLPHFFSRCSCFLLCSTGYLFIYSFFCATQYKREAVLTHVVLFAVCTSLQLQQVRLLTNPMPRLVSLTACSVDRSMGITVNALFCFCRILECLLLMDTAVACFLSCQTKAWSPTPLGTACRSQAV